ncbi:MAG: hypothetical protein ACXVAY_01420 [Mucilaginibacter sp.]
MLKIIWASIKALFAKKTDVAVGDPIVTKNGATQQSTVVTQSDADIAEADVAKAIAIVQNIKKAVGSPIAVLITDLIPGDVDNAIRQTLVDDLPAILAGLTFADSLLTGSDKSTQINTLLANVRFAKEDNLNALYHTLAAKVLMIVSGDTVSWSNAVMAVEYYFTHIFLQGAPDPVVNQAAAPAAGAIAPTATA